MTDELATEGLRSFFQAFEASSAAADVERLVRMFAPALLVAGPTGSQIVKAADLMLAIPKRKQLFDAAGRRSTKLVGLREEALDACYTLARTEWQWQFAPDGSAPTDLTLASTFIVERRDGEPRIVVYLMHADVARELKDRGLIP
jgi:hypothetical protein